MIRYLAGFLTAITVAVLIRDGLTFTMLCWLPSLAAAFLIPCLCRAAADADEQAWRDLERRRPPRSIPR